MLCEQLYNFFIMIEGLLAKLDYARWCFIDIIPIIIITINIIMLNVEAIP